MQNISSLFRRSLYFLQNPNPKMSIEGLTVLDGSRLRDLSTSLPDINGVVTGAELLDSLEAQASSTLLGLSLPQTLKSNALKRINIDLIAFCSSQLDKDKACAKRVDYLNAIADELQDDPIVVSVLDGSLITLFLDDEDDFAMLAENLFTDFDVEDKGKIKKSEIRNALDRMGVEMGVPPLAEFPLLDDILKKHGADGEEELGQAQFAALLQPVLQDLVDALTKERITIIQPKIKVANGFKLRKLLADEKQLNNVIEKMCLEVGTAKGGRECTESIRAFLEKNGTMFGLPPSETNEVMARLYDQVFVDVYSGNTAGELGKDEYVILAKNILVKFAAHLEVSPIFHDHSI